VEIKGWIPATNCRAALQQIAFAIGAYVTTSRTNIIEIYPFVLAADVTSFTAEITKSEKSLQGQSLTLKPLITGVSVTSHNYVANATVRTLYNATLATGQHTIKFTQPAHTLSITGGTITESGANYAIVDVASTGAVEITGRGYDDTAEIVTVETPGLSSSVRKKVLEVKDATLINPDNADDTAQRVYDYYQQRYLQKVKLFASLAKPGDPVLIDTLYNRQLAGIIEKMTTNLTGGFLNTTEIVGVISDAV
jgi:hypothetical protein